MSKVIVFTTSELHSALLDRKERFFYLLKLCRVKNVQLDIRGYKKPQIKLISNYYYYIFKLNQKLVTVSSYFLKFDFVQIRFYPLNKGSMKMAGPCLGF